MSKWINLTVALLVVFAVSVSLGCAKKEETPAPVTTEQAVPAMPEAAPEAAPAPAAPEAPAPAAPAPEAPAAPAAPEAPPAAK
jgi:pyruvate dehydrogenase E2 component (dihydrolipoamide acetyltransferase)